MRFRDDTQDEDDLLADVLAQIDAEDNRDVSSLMAELDVIGKDTADSSPAHEPVKPAPRGTVGWFQSPDFNDPDVIREDVKFTRYDKARKRLADLIAEREALPSGSSPTKRLALDDKIKRAERALEAAKSDVSRVRESIDLWRAGAGRDEYNASRRNGKGTPHADTSNMTEEQKAQHKDDMAFKRTFRSRCRKRGWPDNKIEAELIIRIREREAARAD